MKVALYSQCLGADSQYRAMLERPELFEKVRCMVNLLVVKPVLLEGVLMYFEA